MALRKREVFDDIFALTTAPWKAGDAVKFRTEAMSQTEGGIVPASQINATINSEGRFSQELWCTGDGDDAPPISSQLPSGETRFFVLPYEDGTAVRLSYLYTLYAPPADPQYTTLRAVIGGLIATPLADVAEATQDAIDATENIVTTLNEVVASQVGPAVDAAVAEAVPPAVAAGLETTVAAAVATALPPAVASAVATAVDTATAAMEGELTAYIDTQLVTPLANIATAISDSTTATGAAVDATENAQEIADALAAEVHAAFAHFPGWSIANYPVFRIKYRGPPAIFEAGLPSCDVVSRVPATAASVYSVRKEEVEVGTATFALGGTVATMASAADFVLNDGEYLDVMPPAIPDLTIEDIDVTMGYHH